MIVDPARPRLRTCVVRHREDVGVQVEPGETIAGKGGETQVLCRRDGVDPSSPEFGLCDEFEPFERAADHPVSEGFSEGAVNRVGRVEHTVGAVRRVEP